MLGHVCEGSRRAWDAHANLPMSRAHCIYNQGTLCKEPYIWWIYLSLIIFFYIWEYYSNVFFTWIELDWWMISHSCWSKPNLDCIYTISDWFYSKRNSVYCAKSIGNSVIIISHLIRSTRGVGRDLSACAEVEISIADMFCM